VDVAWPERGSETVAVLVEDEERMIADGFEVAVVRGLLLGAVDRALGAVDIQDQAPRERAGRLMLHDVVMTFDYKGWGDSAGPRSRLAPSSRVADVQAALTFLATLPEVDPGRLGIYGTSYGGATVVWVGAIDARDFVS
jgi:hypothetical protein